MTFDPTKPVQTRDGRKARIICTNRRSPRYPIVAVVDEGENFEEVRTYTADGRQFDVASDMRGSDLINVLETKSWWVNVYGADELGCAHSTKKLADETSCGRTSIIELRMCDGKLVEAIQHEVEDKK